MGPIVAECAKDYADKSIAFVTFDFTDGETKKAAAAAAKKYQVEELFNKRAPGTGFVLLYDTANKRVLTTLSARNNSEEWHAAIDTALGG